MLDFQRETQSLKNNVDYVIGVDEAGRGPLAGPVVAAAFCFRVRDENRKDWTNQYPWDKVADSKVLKEEDREQIFEAFEAGDWDGPPVVYEAAISQPEEIDTLNILQATLYSMTRATYKVIARILETRSAEDTCRFKILVDGNRRPPLMEPTLAGSGYPTLLQCVGSGVCEEQWRNCIGQKMKSISCETIIKGDGSVLSIAAASIVAKVTRDRIMKDLAGKWPDFDLDIHKGYPTPSHKAAVANLGPKEIHRLSFEPCYSLLRSGRHPVPPNRNFDEIVRIKETKKRPAAKAKKGNSKRRRSIDENVQPANP